MKLACQVDGKPGLIVGYVSAKKGKVKAVVLTNGALMAIVLSDVVVLNIPDGLRQTPAEAPEVGRAPKVKVVS